MHFHHIIITDVVNISEHSVQDFVRFSCTWLGHMEATGDLGADDLK